MILKREFYERDTLTVAKELLGKLLVHETKEGTTIGRIVETKRMRDQRIRHRMLTTISAQRGRKFSMDPLGGHAYVYQIYGIYLCFDVTSGRLVGKPEATLVRALEPIDGLGVMMRRRGVSNGHIANLTAGPGKLCVAMGISKKQNGVDLCVPPLRIETGATVDKRPIIQTTRVNVDYADEWKRLPRRFFMKDNDFVSRTN
jgi:DNA-3-methyladenine glycosylase